MKDLKRASINDSIIINQREQLINLESVIKKDDEMIKLHEDRIQEQQKDLKILGLKLRVSKRLTFVGVPGAFLLGYFLAK